MKAYLIDPILRTIVEVNYSGNYKDIYKHIDCTTFQLIRCSKGDGVFVDEEGLYKGPTYQFFGIRGYTPPLIGKGLVLGSNSKGASTTPKLPIDWYKERMIWIEALFLNIMGLTDAKGNTILMHPSKVEAYLLSQPLA